LGFLGTLFLKKLEERIGGYGINCGPKTGESTFKVKAIFNVLKGRGGGKGSLMHKPATSGTIGMRKFNKDTKLSRMVFQTEQRCKGR